MIEALWRINAWTPNEVFCVEAAALEEGYEVYEDEGEVLILTSDGKDGATFFSTVYKMIQESLLTKTNIAIDPATANILPKINTAGWPILSHT